MIKEILKLGDPRLYVTSTEYSLDHIPQIEDVVNDLHDTLMEYRRVHGSGRAIAAPQIGVQKRLLYAIIDDKFTEMINPVLEFPTDEKITVFDDCMSFPDLIVKAERYKTCELTYHDLNWKKYKVTLEGDLAELIQHEYDHLNGILATMRAVDNKSLYLGDINDYRI